MAGMATTATRTATGTIAAGIQRRPLPDDDRDAELDDWGMFDTIAGLSSWADRVHGLTVHDTPQYLVIGRRCDVRAPLAFRR